LTERKTGVVIKNYNGYYYVDSAGEAAPCKLRGRLKKERFSLLTGDRVVFTPPERPGGEGCIENILDRRNRLYKPAIANIDQIAMVFSLKNPDFNQNIADRFLVAAEQLAIPIIICLSKADLLTESDSTGRLVCLYGKIGYKVIKTSVVDNTGRQELQELLTGKTTVFSGLSGVGKSTLLNSFYPELALPTGAVSARNNKGRHTTRFSQLLPAGGGYVADTPGFSLAETAEFTEDALKRAFREFTVYQDNCRFAQCVHLNEPDCAVKAALADGLINQARYDNYCALLLEIRTNAKRRFK
jgi:ribosome biogenesis GTPase